MELDQLIPETVTLTKEIQGEGETRELALKIRPFNVEDESWLKRAFGDELQSKLENMDMDAVSRIAFHQLEIESKREIMKLKFMDMDEDGNEIEISKTGPKKIGQITKGYPEQLELLKALLKSRGFSMPIIEELGEHILNEVGDSTKGKLKASSKK